MSKRKRKQVIVTEDMLKTPSKLVKLVNSVEGPIVTWDPKRDCYGLKADHDYKKKEVITRFNQAC